MPVPRDVDEHDVRLDHLRSEREPGDRGQQRAELARAAVVVGDRASTIVSSATSPAAAAIPARCTLAPPSRCSIGRARATTASLPASTAPNGADEALVQREGDRVGRSGERGERHAERDRRVDEPRAVEVHPAVVPLRGGRERLASARPTASCRRPACACSRGSGARRVLARTSSSTAAGSSRPSGAQSGPGSRPAISTIPIPSEVRTCEAASSTTRSPGCAEREHARRGSPSRTSAPRVAAALPSSAAARSQSAFTDASSPNVAQPSSAARIASHISSVGPRRDPSGGRSPAQARSRCRPGRAPVCSPPSTTTAPLTSTCSTPRA